MVWFTFISLIFSGEPRARERNCYLILVYNCGGLPINKHCCWELIEHINVGEFESDS